MLWLGFSFFSSIGCNESNKANTLQGDWDWVLLSLYFVCALKAHRERERESPLQGRGWSFQHRLCSYAFVIQLPEGDSAEDGIMIINYNSVIIIVYTLEKDSK